MSKGKFGDLIQKARNSENQKHRNTETQSAPGEKTRKPETKKASADDEPMVNLGVKVSLKRRRHWAAESKRNGVSMTDVIIKALAAEFGEPE